MFTYNSGDPTPKTFLLTIDIKESVSNTDFEVVEGDTENYLLISLVDNGEFIDVTNFRIVAVFSHSGGSATQDSADENGGIIISDNTIRIHLNGGSFKRGIVECELQIYGDNPLHVTTTPTFNFSCRPSLVSDITVSSDISHSLFTTMIAQASNAIAAANECVQHSANIPRLYVTYSEENPTLAATPILTETASNFLGICYTTSGMRPTSASDYSWFNMQGSPTISSAQVTPSGEMSLTLSNNETIPVTNMSSCIASLINTHPLATSLSVSGDGMLTLGLSDDSTLQTSGLSSYVSSAISTAATACQPRSIYARGVAVLPTQFVADTTLADFPYKADIPIIGITENHDGMVTFSSEDALSGDFAPVACTSSGKVTIFCKRIPDEGIVIPTIKGEVITND